MAQNEASRGTMESRPIDSRPTRTAESASSIAYELTIVMMPLLAAVFVSDLLESDRTDLPGGVSVIQGPLPFVGLVMTLGLLWHFSTRRGATWADFGAERPESWPRTILTALGVSLGVLAAVVVVINPVLNALSVSERDMTRFDVLYDDLPNLFVNLPIMLITAGFLEEFVFRGYLINRLLDLQGGATRLTWTIALIGSSVVFALPHVDQGLEGMIRVGAIGFVFGIAFMLVGRKIWPLVLSHAFIDTLDFISHYFTEASA
ncbi:MAG: CPBP family intramembrane glutamic endopeptidase [Acidimicrobiales bacterium]